MSNNWLVGYRCGACSVLYRVIVIRPTRRMSQSEFSRGYKAGCLAREFGVDLSAGLA